MVHTYIKFEKFDLYNWFSDGMYEELSGLLFIDRRISQYWSLLLYSLKPMMNEKYTAKIIHDISHFILFIYVIYNMF